MRLIDAYELTKMLYVEGVNVLDFASIEYCEKLIINAPTIDPVKHGRWNVQLDARRYCECSECGFRPEYKYNFCPNCGSRNIEEMDGGEE